MNLYIILCISNLIYRIKHIPIPLLIPCLPIEHLK